MTVLVTRIEVFASKIETLRHWNERIWKLVEQKQSVWNVISAKGGSTVVGIPCGDIGGHGF